MVLLYRLYQWLVRGLMAFFPWHMPLLIEGEGSVLQLPSVLIKDNVKKPLLITGPTLRRLGTMDGLARALETAGIPAVIFDRVANDPTFDNVEDAYTCYREHGCDAIIAFGGGSPMDCAKLCGARVARSQTALCALCGVRLKFAMPYRRCMPCPPRRAQAVR